jgi:hypothetical protein
MKLVVIDGAPEVGTLTTPRALAALTGFRTVHNHLSFDSTALRPTSRCRCVAL